MINIVQAFFRESGRGSHTVPSPRLSRIPVCLALVPALLPLAGEAAPIPSRHDAPASARPVAALRIPCDPRVDCPGRRPPGPPDRDVRPFDGTLGRPCAYRWRFTPSGTRRVRVCY